IIIHPDKIIRVDKEMQPVCATSHEAPPVTLVLRWRNTNARHPDVLAAQRRERARIRSEKGIRWGGRPLPAAA
ncbi:hypothetical protein ACFCZY_40070, partial [Streptomyces sp. NPDC056237]